MTDCDFLQWKRISYYFDDLDIYHWGVEFLERVLLHIFQGNSELQNRLLRFAVHLVATDSLRAKNLAYWGRATWYYEEVAHYGGDFLEETVKFMTHRSDMYTKLESLATKCASLAYSRRRCQLTLIIDLEESRGESYMKPMWYDEEFAELTRARATRQFDPLQASCILRQEADIPRAPIYRANLKMDSTELAVVPRIALDATATPKDDQKVFEQDNKKSHCRRTSSVGREHNLVVAKKIQEGEESLNAKDEEVGIKFLGDGKPMLTNSRSLVSLSTQNLSVSEVSSDYKRASTIVIDGEHAERNIEKLSDKRTGLGKTSTSQKADTVSIGKEKMVCIENSETKALEPEKAKKMNKQQTGQPQIEQSNKQGKKAQILPGISSQSSSGQKNYGNQTHSLQDVRSVGDAQKKFQDKKVSEQRGVSNESNNSTNANRKRNDNPKRQEGNSQQPKQQVGDQTDRSYNKKKLWTKRNKQDLRVDTTVHGGPTYTITEVLSGSYPPISRPMAHQDDSILSFTVNGRKHVSPERAPDVAEAPRMVQSAHGYAGNARSTSSQTARNFRQPMGQAWAHHYPENQHFVPQHNMQIQYVPNHPPPAQVNQGWVQYPTMHMAHMAQPQFQATATHMITSDGQMPVIAHPYNQFNSTVVHGIQQNLMHYGQAQHTHQLDPTATPYYAQGYNQQPRGFNNHTVRGRKDHRARYPDDQHFVGGAYQHRCSNHQGGNRYGPQQYPNSSYAQASSQQPPNMPRIPKNNQSVHPLHVWPTSSFVTPPQSESFRTQDSMSKTVSRPESSDGTIVAANDTDDDGSIIYRPEPAASVERTDDLPSDSIETNTPLHSKPNELSINSKADEENIAAPAFTYPIVYPPAETFVSKKDLAAEYSSAVINSPKNELDFSSSEKLPISHEVVEPQLTSVSEKEEERPCTLDIEECPAHRSSAITSEEEISPEQAHESGNQTSKSNKSSESSTKHDFSVTEIVTSTVDETTESSTTGDKFLNQMSSVAGNLAVMADTVSTKSPETITHKTSSSLAPTWAEKANENTQTSNPSLSGDMKLAQKRAASTALLSPHKDPSMSYQNLVRSTGMNPIRSFTAPWQHRGFRASNDEFEDPFKLYVAGVGLTNDSLVKIFESYRPRCIATVRPCKTTPDTRRPTLPNGMMFTFVTFHSAETCKEVKSALAGQVRENIRLKVNSAFDRNGQDRSLDERNSVLLPWINEVSGSKNKETDVGVRSKIKPSPKTSPVDSKLFWSHVKKQERNVIPSAASKSDKSGTSLAEVMRTTEAIEKNATLKQAELPTDKAISPDTNPMPKDAIITVQSEQPTDEITTTLKSIDIPSKIILKVETPQQTIEHPPVVGRVKKDKKIQAQKKKSKLKDLTAKEAVDAKLDPVSQNIDSHSISQQHLSQATTATTSPQMQARKSIEESNASSRRNSNSSKIDRAVVSVLSWFSPKTGKLTGENEQTICAADGLEYSTDKSNGDTEAANEISPAKETPDKAKGKKKNPQPRGKGKKFFEFSNKHKDSLASKLVTPDKTSDGHISTVKETRIEQIGGPCTITQVISKVPGRTSMPDQQNNPNNKASPQKVEHHGKQIGQSTGNQRKYSKQSPRHAIDKCFQASFQSNIMNMLTRLKAIESSKSPPKNDRKISSASMITHPGVEFPALPANNPTSANTNLHDERKEISPARAPSNEGSPKSVKHKDYEGWDSCVKVKSNGRNQKTRRVGSQDSHSSASSADSRAKDKGLSGLADGTDGLKRGKSENTNWADVVKSGESA